MKKTILLTIFAITLALFAGVFVYGEASAQSSLVPWNVIFEVEYQGDTFSYNLQSQITHLDDGADARGFYLGYSGKTDIYTRLRSMQLPALAVYEYILPNFEAVLDHFDYVNRDKRDATVTFSKNGFNYAKEQDGVAIDAQKLFELALTSRGKKVQITLPLLIDKAVTIAELKKNTAFKASFTTSYHNSNANRCFNIDKAVEALSGITVDAGETFSFNNTVGARTEERGYKTSKVILDGAYTEGIGGGVCQVSTTLYNALLLAGFIPKATQHTLISSYVKSGFDAMVSYGAVDLTFVNDTEHPIYISAYTHNKEVTFTVYGEPNKYRIERVSTEERDKFRTVEIVDADKYPELVYTDQTKIVTAGSDGVKTQSYLKYYVGDTLIETKLIRKNSYKRVDQVVARGCMERPIEME